MEAITVPALVQVTVPAEVGKDMSPKLADPQCQGVFGGCLFAVRNQSPATRPAHVRPHFLPKSPASVPHALPEQSDSKSSRFCSSARRPSSIRSRCAVTSASATASGAASDSSAASTVKAGFPSPRATGKPLRPGRPRQGRRSSLLADCPPLVERYHRVEGCQVFAFDRSSPFRCAVAVHPMFSVAVVSLKTNSLTPGYCSHNRQFGFSLREDPRAGGRSAFPSASPWCPVSMAASRSRSAGERLSTAAASFASGSASAASSSVPWSASSRSPILPWSASSASAFAFSRLLVQTLVQTGEVVAVGLVALRVATHRRLTVDPKVAGSIPVVLARPWRKFRHGDLGLGSEPNPKS